MANLRLCPLDAPGDAKVCSTSTRAKSTCWSSDAFGEFVNYDEALATDL